MYKFQCYCCKRNFESDINCLITLETRIKNGQIEQYTEVPVCKSCKHFKEINNEKE